MYKRMRLETVVRVPPEKLGMKIEDAVREGLIEDLQERIDRNIGMIVAILDVVEIGEGRILVGDGGVYYDTVFDALVFKPEIQEIVEGEVVEIVEFGAFVSIGPLDGLVHVSQIMDDYISYDQKSSRLIGKEEKKSLAEGDRVRARIVTVSLNEREPKESKIGLTMRQPGLGKLEWIEEERRKEMKENA